MPLCVNVCMLCCQLLLVRPHMYMYAHAYMHSRLLAEMPETDHQSSIDCKSPTVAYFSCYNTYVCMYVYIYIHMHVYINIWMYNTYVCMYVYIYIHMHVYINIWMYTYTCVCIWPWRVLYLTTTICHGQAICAWWCTAPILSGIL